jgi:hypothetical protein
MSEAESTIEAAPKLGRVRRRTHAEMVARYRALEEFAQKREWRIQLLVDNLPPEGDPVDALSQAPNDTEIMLLAGPGSSAPALTERYVIIKGATPSNEGETAGVMRDMRAFIQVQYQVASKSAELAERSLDAMNKTIESCGKLASAATKATKKQFKAEKARMESEGIIASSLKEIGAILGPEKSAAAIGMVLNWVDEKISGGTKSKSRPKSKPKSRSKSRSKSKPKSKPKARP